MRIVLADPPNLSNGWRVANHPNLGILYLSAYLKNTFPDVDVLYLEQHLDLEKHIAAIEAYNPDLYGISFATLWANDAEDTVKEVSRRFPDLKIVAGGPHPSAAPEKVVQIPGMDACALGEGEETMAELVRHFVLEEKALEDINGIAYADDGRMKVTPPQPVFRDLDALPLPDWDLVDFRRYKGNYQFKASPSTCMITSRGCAFDCNFCSNPVWNTARPWVRMRSPESICEEVTVLYNRGIRDIYIRSDEANVTGKWFMGVSSAIKELGYKDLYFQCNMRADHISEEMAELYADHGGWLIYLGIESGNQRTIDGIGKYVTLEGVEFTCRAFKKYGVDIFGLFMIYHVWEENNKLCYETYEDVNKGTLGFIRRLRKDRLLDYISFTTATPMPGSRLWHTAVKYKLVDPDMPIKDFSAFTMKIPGVTSWQMKITRLRGMLLQLWFVLRSGNTVWSDWNKLKIKLKYVFESLLPERSSFSGPLSGTKQKKVKQTYSPSALKDTDHVVARYGKRHFPTPEC